MKLRARRSIFVFILGVVLLLQYNCKPAYPQSRADSTVQKTKNLIVGTWIATHGGEGKWVFTKNGKTKTYIKKDGESTLSHFATYTYNIYRKGIHCGC